MSATATKFSRRANLQLSNTPSGPVLKAALPPGSSAADFARVGQSAYALIFKLTGCNCLSGRISVVVEDDFAHAINVELPEVAG
jgi:hypothetical protein